MMKKRFYICLGLLICSLLATYCKEKVDFNETEMCSISDPSDIFNPSYIPDSIDILLPSLACSECLVTSKNLINGFFKKKRLNFILMSNGNLRNTKIIYDNELQIKDAVKIDDSEIYKNIVSGYPQNIWLVLYKDECTYKVRIDGGMEEGLVSLLKRI